LRDEGVPTSRIAAMLFDFLKAGKGGMTARPWGEAVSAWVRASTGWNSNQLDAACDALLRSDILLKETRVSSDEQILTSLVMEICTGQTSANSKPAR
jgi:DNA polymerase-3 subunit delta